MSRRGGDQRGKFASSLGYGAFTLGGEDQKMAQD